ncbi:hypothetical protein ABNB59_17310 [Paenibacillus larvae]|uniref:Uncharacterized protein n=1 Tax=Paenibacillus larvae TaxID=1464 RepID=A0AAP5JWD6_9BACL|nr:hypothetical protein [Paenibacillus larvae]AQR77232.1 hypothetical protein BXP28_07510 [Paenibacillus larvae subsp. larvae]AVF21804.1 hypothetical protein ERICI_01941 [Paenibacillus larvae subsp. larvae]ETK27501.1 hypothetical protein ERIC1_1c09470 [Paenibacillus larvae subsp. larvae DSM 25719]MCY7489783.1 hypothetical protein [Paenibacillus larvae]MCY9565001.1 hypothetical protein [Paenibacillus larvae]
MGCDIHLFVEKKVNGAWKVLKGINEPRIQDLCSTLQKAKERGADTLWLEDWIKEEKEGTCDFVNIPRNYRLYAALANVRNYDRITPISTPRGLPSDMSRVVYEQENEWYWGHDHSWLTAKELSEFDWNQKIKFEGFVDDEQYSEFLENGVPTWWHFEQRSWGKPYKHIQWTETLKDCVDTFYTWSIPKLIELADGDLESVRIVFWFDN